ncbi:ArsR family transcriptional regulator [Candidatus Thorarchaeota archaeon]|nr:MAG: ArsR family transcriptional regulator [Candidatus Thorarchaeota archaeon]
MSSEITDGIKGIELTEEAKKPQDDIVFITDEERAQIINDPVRLQILQVLREGIDDTLTTRSEDPETGTKITREREVKRDIMSVLEIVRQSKECCGPDDQVSKNQVYHHLPKLEKGGFVVKYGTITTGEKGGRTTDYYRRTAKGFVLATGFSTAHDKAIEKKTQHWVSSMLESFDLDVPEDKKQRLIELTNERVRMQSKWRRTIAELVKVDVADKEVLEIYGTLLDYYSTGSEDYMKILREIREILFPDEPPV